MTTLYSLRSDGDQYRITKFVDGEVESSYFCTVHECECPAGHRHTCRHRQMLPQLLAEGIVDTHWFWDFDIRRVVDFSGMLKSNFDAMNELAAIPGVTVVDIANPAELHNTLNELFNEPERAAPPSSGQGKAPWRRL